MSLPAKQCPFCGGAAMSWKMHGKFLACCADRECPGYQTSCTIDQWNKRAESDGEELDARLTELGKVIMALPMGRERKLGPVKGVQALRTRAEAAETALRETLRRVDYHVTDDDDRQTLRGAILNLLPVPMSDPEIHRCFVCQEPFRAGEMVLSDVSEGLGHRACFGEDRNSYVKDIDTGEPLGPDDPIPTGEPYDPTDYSEHRAEIEHSETGVCPLRGEG